MTIYKVYKMSLAFATYKPSYRLFFFETSLNATIHPRKALQELALTALPGLTAARITVTVLCTIF